MGRRGRWAQAHEVERLEQLRYDLDSALGRYHAACLRCAERVGPETAQRWLEIAAEVEQVRATAVRRVELWVSERCGEGG